MKRYFKINIHTKFIRLNRAFCNFYRYCQHPIFNILLLLKDLLTGLSIMQFCVLLLLCLMHAAVSDVRNLFNLALSIATIGFDICSLVTFVTFGDIVQII